MGMSVLQRVRMIAPKGRRLTTGVLIQARLYIHKHSGMSTSARTVDEMVMTMLENKTHQKQCITKSGKQLTGSSDL